MPLRNVRCINQKPKNLKAMTNIFAISSAKWPTLAAPGKPPAHFHSVPPWPPPMCIFKLQGYTYIHTCNWRSTWFTWLRVFGVARCGVRGSWKAGGGGLFRGLMLLVLAFGGSLSLHKCAKFWTQFTCSAAKIVAWSLYRPTYL